MPPVIQDSEEEGSVDEAGSINHKRVTKPKYDDSESELSEPEDLELNDEDEVEVEVEDGDQEDDDDDDDDDDDEDDDDDDDLNDTTHYSEEEEIAGMSDDEETYKLEDLDDIDEDLELKDEDVEEEVIKPTTVKISVNSGSVNRDSRKRHLSYYEDDEEDEISQETKSRTKPAKVIKRVTKIQPTELDADLILTDEEAEYNPHANFDLAKLTSRQRAMYEEEEAGKSQKFLELDANPIKPKRKRKETDQEIALRKAESARRRQDYKNKQLEEEKQDTLNKLLKRRATKTRETVSKEGTIEISKIDKPLRPTLQHPGLFRYINNTTNLNGNSLLAFNTK